MAKPRHTRFDCNPRCAVEATVSLIDGKWKCVILHHLLEGTARFNGLRRRLPEITPRMLTAQLRELEADGLVRRTVYAEVPPKVEYDLTELGRSLEPIIAVLRTWGLDHLHLFSRSAGNAVPVVAVEAGTLDEIPVVAEKSGAEFSTVAELVAHVLAAVDRSGPDRARAAG